MQVEVEDDTPVDHPDQIMLDEPSYTKNCTDHIGEVVRGALVVNTTVPVSAPKAAESTGMESVVASMIVAVFAPFTPTQLPVPPDTKMFGLELTLKPCPPLMVSTVGLALLADATEMAGDTG